MSKKIKDDIICTRCKYKNTKTFIEYFDYCESCGLNLKKIKDEINR